MVDPLFSVLILFLVLLNVFMVLPLLITLLDLETQDFQRKPGQEFHSSHDGHCCYAPSFWPFVPQNISCPAATVTFVPRPHLPNLKLLLFHNFLLCLALSISVFRHQCWLLGFRFVIGQTLLKQGEMNMICTLV